MKNEKRPEGLPTKPTKPNEMFVFEMKMYGFVNVEDVDDLIAILDMGEESVQQLREWRYLAERAYNDGQIDLSVALIRLTLCTAVYARESKAAFPPARAKIAHKKTRQKVIKEKALPERHKAEKWWHEKAIKYHQQGRSGCWISDRLGEEGPSKSAVNRFLRKIGASPVIERADM